MLGVILAVSSRNETTTFKSDRPVTPHTYYYYPKANFYYDSTAGNYICWDSSTTSWRSTEELPVQEVDLGKRVRIGEAVAPVWKENQNHRLIYSVSLYSEPEDFKKKEKPVVESHKLDSIFQEEKDGKKSGVKKFFERIFPPKKKKDS